MNKQTIIIGLDLGTQGVRAIAADEKGNVLASSSCAYERINAAVSPLKEQVADDWEKAAFRVLTDLSGTLRQQSIFSENTVLAVDGTSGTIVPIGKDGKPLINAIMYNDPRAFEEAKKVHAAGYQLEEKLGYRFNASYALPRMLWIRDHLPDVYRRTCLFIHQADYIVGCLTGEFGVTDYSNALKSGYDLIDECWPGFIGEMGLDMDKLPKVIAPGMLIEKITKKTAERTGLPENTVVAAGVSDGYASCVASGAVSPGQYNTTIGTTLVIKGVTKNFIKDDQGRIYCHKHPQGYWYPGGAGNVGGLCLNQWFGEENFKAYDLQVPHKVPSGNLMYPLLTKGERFPFVNADAEGFAVIKDDSILGKYAGTMEGVGYVERLSYDTMAALGCETGNTIMIAGGAVKAPVWSQIRADILGKELLQPEIVEAAMGTAVIAGTVFLNRTLEQAAREMIKFCGRFTPDMKRHNEYDQLYQQFKEQCRLRGYIDEHL